MVKFDQEYHPLLREQKGFIKMYQLMDQSSGKGAQVHFWETEADLEAYLKGPVSQKIQSQVQAIVKDHTTGAPTSQHYQVVNEV